MDEPELRERRPSGHNPSYLLRPLEPSFAGASSSSFASTLTNASTASSTAPLYRQPSHDEKVQLERKVGLTSGVALIVGTMIGSGIFISPRDVLQRSGSVAASLLIWFVCGVFSMIGALCYIELGCVVPKSGGDYSYLLDSYGPLHRFFGAIPAFLYSYTRVLVTGPCAFAVISLSFGSYTSDPFFADCGAPIVVRKLIAILCILVVTWINCYSVQLATKIQTFFTAVKLMAITVIIVSGIVKLAQGNKQYLATGFTPFVDKITLGNIATAFYSGLWAYDGWNNLNFVTEEIKSPYKNLPRSIWIGLPLVTVCYVMVNVAYLTVMSSTEILGSEAVAVTYGNRVLSVMAWFIPFAVACSTFGAANGTVFGNGRLCLVTAREGHLVDFLSFVNVKMLTPSPALLCQCSIALLMVVSGDISSLIDFFSFTSWVFYGLTISCVLILRWSKKDVGRPYKVPLVFPIFMLCVSSFLVFVPIVEEPRMEYLYSALFVLSGILVYIPFVYCKKTVPLMGHFTVFVQLLLNISPAEGDWENAPQDGTNSKSRRPSVG